MSGYFVMLPYDRYDIDYFDNVYDFEYDFEQDYLEREYYDFYFIEDYDEEGWDEFTSVEYPMAGMNVDQMDILQEKLSGIRIR